MDIVNPFEFFSSALDIFFTEFPWAMPLLFGAFCVSIIFRMIRILIDDFVSTGKPRSECDDCACRDPQYILPFCNENLSNRSQYDPEHWNTSKD